MSFRGIVPFSSPETIKIHIRYVLPSIYRGQKLIIYAVFGKHKQWWHELMCTAEDMEQYKERANLLQGGE